MTSPRDQAFHQFWLQARGVHPDESLACHTARAAFCAGAEWTTDVMSDRSGSSLRGRVVVMHRPLLEAELEREGVGREVLWPAVQLDDGTLVYAAVVVDERASPAKLVGQRIGPSGEVQRVSFEMQVQSATLESVRQQDLERSARLLIASVSSAIGGGARHYDPVTGALLSTPADVVRCLRDRGDVRLEDAVEP